MTKSFPILPMWQSKLTLQKHISRQLLTEFSVIVSTGLMALVDDSIRRKWHSRHHRQLILPLSPSLKMGMEYIGPRRLIDEVFNRGSYAAASRTR